MSPSFLEQTALAQAAAALQRSGQPAVWRRETTLAVSRVRPAVLITAPEAAGLRAAWALAQVSRTTLLSGLRWDASGRPSARGAEAGAAVTFEVRELEAGMGGGLQGALRRALAARAETPGLIVFLSAGWGAGALAKAAGDPFVRARAAQWRRCYLLADRRCLPLHPRSRLSVQG